MEEVINIEENRDAMAVRLQLMRQAKSRIRMAVFEFHRDAAGRRIMAALAQSAGRGVQVQLLIDGICLFYGLFYSQEFQTLSRMGNVHVRVYNPFKKDNMRHPNCRMHDKYLLIDDSWLLLGGRNVGNAFLEEDIGKIKKDRDLLVHEQEPGRGQAYRQLSAYFESVWNSPYVKDWEWAGISSEMEKDARYQLKRISWESEKLYEDILPRLSFFPADSVELAANPIQADKKDPQLFRRILRDAGDYGNVQIQTPYVILDQDMKNEYKKYLRDARGITIVTNAPERGSNYFGSSDLMTRRQRILDEGVRLCEYSDPQQVLHGKMILAGQDITYIGSFNLDNRSCCIDMEADLRVKSRPFHDHMEETFQELLRHCRIQEEGKKDVRGDLYWPHSMSKKRQTAYRALSFFGKPLRRLM